MQYDDCHKAGPGRHNCLFANINPPRGHQCPCVICNTNNSHLQNFLLFVFTAAILHNIFQMQAFF